MNLPPVGHDSNATSILLVHQDLAWHNVRHVRIGDVVACLARVACCCSRIVRWCRAAHCLSHRHATAWSAHTCRTHLHHCIAMLCPVSQFAKATKNLEFLSIADVRVLALTYMLCEELMGKEELEAHVAKYAARRRVAAPAAAKPSGTAGGKGPAGARATAPASTGAGTAAGDGGAAAPKAAPRSWGARPKPSPAPAPAAEEEAFPSLKSAAEAGLLATGVLEPDLKLAAIDEQATAAAEERASAAEAAHQAALAAAAAKAAEARAAAGPAEPRVVPGGSRVLGGGGGAAVIFQSAQAAEDDAEGWVGPDNFAEGLEGGMLGARAKQSSQFPTQAACVTTDYTMQNVLLGMGIALVSVSGRAITSVKQFVLKCDACFTVIRDLSRMFCPACGNATLSRLGVTVDKQGREHFHYAKNRRVNSRGGRHAISTKDVGGKSGGLLLREDQLLTGAWAARVRSKPTESPMWAEAADVKPSMHAGWTGPGVNGSTAPAGAARVAVRGRRDVVVGSGGNPNSRKGRERRGAKKKNKQR